MFSELVGQIYDAALAPQNWPQALDAITRYVNAQTAALLSYDVLDKTPPWQLQVGYDPHWMQIYSEKYLALNPYMDEVAALGAGELNCSSRRPNYQDLFQTEFYQGWLKPQGFIDASVLVVEKSMNNITTLVNVRNESQGRFDDPAMARLGELYPHLRRAVLIGRTFEEQQKRIGEYAATLDSLAAAMFLLTDKGEIVQANAAGEAMLAAGSTLKNSKGRLELTVESANRVLRAALAAGSNGDVGSKGSSIPLRENDGAENHYVMHMLPLNAGRQQSIDAERNAAFVLFVRLNDPGNAAAIATFARTFDLTPKETSVLQTVVEVGGVPAAADVLGISPATVRTHVTSIFDKSGVRRQADLIRLLIDMKSPFLK